VTNEISATAPEGTPVYAPEDIAEQKAVRLAKRARLIQDADSPAGGAYPVSLPITTTIAEVRAKFPELEADVRTGETVGLAGRVVHSRNTGKPCFAAL